MPLLWFSSFQEGRKPFFFNFLTYTVKGGSNMAGHLLKHPYYRTFDEAQRSEKRMRTYLDMNWTLLSDEEKERIQVMIEALSKVVRNVPEEYQITRHFQKEI